MHKCHRSRLLSLPRQLVILPRRGRGIQVQQLLRVRTEPMHKRNKHNMWPMPSPGARVAVSRQPHAAHVHLLGSINGSRAQQSVWNQCLHHCMRIRGVRHFVCGLQVSMHSRQASAPDSQYAIRHSIPVNPKRSRHEIHLQRHSESRPDGAGHRKGRHSFADDRRGVGP